VKALHVADELVCSAITCIDDVQCKVCVKLRSTRECSSTSSTAASGLVRHGPSVASYVDSSLYDVIVLYL